MEYWSWWIGALALGGLAALYGLLIKKPLGVSGSWMRVVNWRNDKELKEAQDFFKEDQKGATDDLLAATLAEFGEVAMDELKDKQDVPADNASSSQSKSQSSTEENFVPALAHFIFLVFMIVGSYLATFLGNGFEIQFELSKIHTEIFGSTYEIWLSLFLGGMMVGFGTQMAGGCTSGHGLSGCSQFIPASLVATATFFLSASVLSVFMDITR